MEALLPFSRYVSQYWGTHINTSVADEIKELAAKLLDDQTLMATLSQLLHINSPAGKWQYNHYPAGFGGAHFGAYFNLTAAFEKWPDPNDWKVPKDSWDRTLLHLSLLSPGQFTRHSIIERASNTEIAILLTGREVATTSSDAISVAKTMPDDDNREEEDDDKEEEDNNEDDSKDGEDDDGMFTHDPVREFPWSNSEGDPTRLMAIISSSRDEMATSDKDGTTTLHYVASSWPEQGFLVIYETLFDVSLSSHWGSDRDTEDGSNDSNLLPQLLDGRGRTILDCACERNVVFGSVVLYAANWSTEQINSAMAAAASGGHTIMVTALPQVAENRSEPSHGPDLDRACLEAARRGFTDIDAKGMTPLHYAACGGHLDTVRYLLLEGADANQLNNAGRTSLFCATENGNDGIVTLLAEKGVSAKATNSEGHTSLQLAARDGNLDVVQKLLHFEPADRPAARGSSPTLAMTPLHFAAQRGHSEIVRLLLRDAAADDGDSISRTPLSYACEAGRLSAVKTLLARNVDASKPEVDVNSRDGSGRTALSYAAAGGYLDVVRALMAQDKVDSNIPDHDDRTPLIRAAQQGHDMTAIFMAISNLDAEEEKVPIITEVLARITEPRAWGKVVSLDAADDCGRTALSYLAEAGNVDAVKVLCSLGARLELRDKEDKTTRAMTLPQRNPRIKKGTAMWIAPMVKMKGTSLKDERPATLGGVNGKDVLEKKPNAYEVNEAGRSVMATKVAVLGLDRPRSGHPRYYCPTCCYPICTPNLYPNG
ncbi:ankyrin repeat-containing domain protein [Phialemonium atrogriseum]|uniref:Ankyrin repeat-containing domain protein n=1 Tax=Phialemonium atrogriseum TaxID=1093897 RepID=A0AAJ0FC40_9PEZI|nr:ankyrin repeat-containing domain protein [Phialemonium atrogriseum]KAK1761742.1 ankyrin repeat-containing domain protein [Phialemonium atrogriseum]